MHNCVVVVGVVGYAIGLAPGIQATLSFQLWIWDFSFEATAKMRQRALFVANSHTVRGVSIGLMFGVGEHPRRPYLTVSSDNKGEVTGAHMPRVLQSRQWYQFHVAVVYDAVHVYVNGQRVLQVRLVPQLHQTASLDGPRCPLGGVGGPTHYRHVV